MLRCLPSVVLCVLLLAAHWPSVCWARPEQSDGCMFDQIAKESGPLPVITVKDTPKQSSSKTFQAYTVSTDDAWRLMRIQTSMEPFQSNSLVCKDHTNGPKVKNMFNREVPCVNRQTKLRAAEYLAGEVLERATKLHTDRLLVQPLSGKIKVPAFDSNNFCSHFQVPEAHKSTGFSDADMMLYVAISPLGKGHVYSTAAPCATINGGRPVVGGFVFDPKYISLEQDSVRIAAHDIAHALGFSYSNMKAKSITTTATVRGEQRTVVNSANVKQAAQAHYGCKSIDGMELENGEQGSNGKQSNEMLSHWERRNAKDELMAYPLTQRSDTFFGLYTALTLSAFEDLGYYKAKYDMAEPMAWGHKAGCDFLNYSCKENGKDENKLPTMFCKDATKENFVCTSDRQGIGKCTLSYHFERDYPALGRSAFGALSLGNDKAGAAQRDDFLTDFCPVVSSMMSCSWKYYEPGTLLESLDGAQALCLDGESLKEKDGSKNGKDVYAVCAEIRCENKTVTVRFQGVKNSVECPEGESIAPPSSKYKSGSVKCPTYDEVCTVNAYGKSLVTPDASKVPEWKRSETEATTTTDATAVSTAQDSTAQ